MSFLKGDLVSIYLSFFERAIVDEIVAADEQHGDTIVDSTCLSSPEDDIPFIVSASRPKSIR